MSLPSLADDLTDTAGTLRQHAARLDGKAFVTAADKFTKAFALFRKVLAAAVAGAGPETEELRAALHAAFPGEEKAAKDALKAFAKRQLPPTGVPLAGTDTAARYRDKVATALGAVGRAEAATAALRRRAAPPRLDLGGDDRLHLLQQVRELGRMGAEEREEELEKLLQRPADVRRLAVACSVKHTAKTPLPKLLAALTEHGRRLAENTGR